MAAERERRAASLRRRDERYDPAAVAPMWALFQRKLDLQSAMREEGGREGQRGSGRGKRSRGVAARSVTAAGRGAGGAAGLLRLSGSGSSRRLSGLVEPSLWGLAVSCDPSNLRAWTEVWRTVVLPHALDRGASDAPSAAAAAASAVACAARDAPRAAAAAERARTRSEAALRARIKEAFAALTNQGLPPQEAAVQALEMARRCP